MINDTYTDEIYRLITQDFISDFSNSEKKEINLKYEKNK